MSDIPAPVKITVCPVCGQEVLFTCYHEGADVASVEMDIEKAIELTKEVLDEAEGMLEKYKSQLEEYTERMKAVRE